MNKTVLNILLGVASAVTAAGLAYACYTTVRHAPNPSPLEAALRAKLAAHGIEREWDRIVKEVNRNGP